MSIGSILTLLALLLLYAFCEMSRAAICELSESAVEESAQSGDKRAKRLLKFLADEDTFRARVQFCRMCSGIIFALYFFDKLFGLFFFNIGIYLEIGTFLVLLLCFLIISVFGTMIPKKLGIQHSESIALSSVSLLNLLLVLTFPFYFVCSAISGGLLRLFGANPNADERVTEEDIRSLVDEGEEKGVIDDSQRDMINNIFEFDDITAGDVMTHRTEISAIELTDSLQDTVKVAIAKGFSRIPVFEEDLDNIVGIMYVKDLLPYVGKQIPKSVTPAEFMRSVYMVPESKRCGELFAEMTEKRVQMAVVVDEYGGTAGLVTLEDLIESILGNIQDEYDHETEDIVAVSESSFTIDGTCDIEEVEEMLEISFPEGDYDTLGGFLVAQLGVIPAENEHPVVSEQGYRFTVQSVADYHIDKVLAEKEPE